MNNSTRKVYPVAVVNRYVQTILSADPTLSSLWVKGEISNFKHHSSGHLYFTLKDPAASVSCVMFSSDASSLKFFPKNGDQVMAFGRVSLYEKTGMYQLYIRKMEEEGIGNLYEAFERLKTKLQEEGIFDPSHKKPIPKFPRRIGVVTAGTGAVIHDIEQVSKRRNPGVDLVLYPSRVQGDGAAKTIVEGIRALDRMEEIDVIIVGRGGGSLEDLWPFNEEIVARAIYNAQTPIISAVGHETDFTIADFAADLRAPTPSAAAELAVPDIVSLRKALKEGESRRISEMKKAILLQQNRLEMMKQRLSMNSPKRRIEAEKQQLDLVHDAQINALARVLKERKMTLERLAKALELSSPLHPLSKGYAFITDDTGKITTTVDRLSKGSSIQITMIDGTATATVEKIMRKKNG